VIKYSSHRARFWTDFHSTLVSGEFLRNLFWKYHEGENKESIKIKRRWSATLESGDSPTTSTSPTLPTSAKWFPMSIVPTAATAVGPVGAAGNLAPYHLSLSPTSLAANTVYSNMAYMNNSGSPAGLPYMLSQAATGPGGGNPNPGALPNSNSAVALLNVSNLLSQKDSRWLQLEVCREFQRNKCSRSDTECKFAHPAANVEVQNGRVTACYDSIKVSWF